MRAGAQALLMATDPINREILQKMLERPLKVGSGGEYRVTSGGREGLFVGFVAERWLQGAPQGPVPFDSREAERAVAALAEGWSATVGHALTREPLTLRALDGVVEGLRKRAPKRHLSAMQSASQIGVLPDGGTGALSAATDRP